MKHYRIHPSTISLGEFRKLISNRRMLPGRLALQEQMESRFGLLARCGIETLEDLLRLLSSKSKIESISNQTGLSTNYLVLLKREGGSYLARPFPLSDFPGIPFEYVELLKSRGIRNTRDLFEKVQTEEQQKELSLKTGIPVYRLKELYALCDLSRITGVGGIFARIVYEAGIRSTIEFAQRDLSKQLDAYKDVIEKYGYAAGNLGEKDISYAMNYARLIVTCDNKTDME